MHPISDDHRWLSGLGLCHEGGDILGAVLPVAVHNQGPGKPTLISGVQPRLQRGSFPEIAGMAKHRRAGVCRQRGRVVARTVIHDHDLRDVTSDRANQRGDGSSLIQAGNHSETVSGLIHGINLFHYRKKPKQNAKRRFLLQNSDFGLYYLLA